MEASEFGRLSPQHEGLMLALRAFGANYTEFTRRFAGWLDLHSSDAAALVEILYAEDKGTPLSPARLSERVSLSSGATTALVNRLEQAGHVVRTREHTDRRIVSLRSGPNIYKPATEFFGPFSTSLDAVMSGYPPELLRQFEAFLNHLCTTMDALLLHEYQEARLAARSPSGED